MALCYPTAVLLLNAQHATPHLICLESGTSKTNFKTLPHKEKSPTPESLSTDLALQPDSIVYLCCMTIRFQLSVIARPKQSLHYRTKA